MVSITQLAHEIVRSVLRPGEFAIDATAGNGHDTLFLARHVGPQGTILAIDLQVEALESTAQRLQTANASAQVRLIHGSHADLWQLVPDSRRGTAAAVMFNLGYLPFHDHAFTTQASSTCAAIQAALQLLRPGGTLTVMAYRGHPGGEEEALAVEAILEALPATSYAGFRFPTARPQRGPQLFAVRKLTSFRP